MPEPRAVSAGACGFVCIAILVTMLVLHAWPIWAGRPVYLKVVPVDPRDLFRGDYVVLGYDLNRLEIRVPEGSASEPGSDPEARQIGVRPLGDWWADIAREVEASKYALFWKLRDKVLYVQLEAEESRAPGVPELYKAVSLSDEVEVGKINMRGRVRNVRAWSPASESGSALTLTMRYGIDALFVQENTGHAIEQAIAQGRDVYAKVAVTSSGRARLRDLIIDGIPLTQEE